MGGIAMNPSMGAPARTSLCATVPPMALFIVAASRADRPACFTGTPGVRAAHTDHAAGRDRGVEHAPTVHGAPRGGLAPTLACAALFKKEGFRDRARQDVAPGAPMDGFMAFPEALFLEQRCAGSPQARARREARA
jgi:hypothetical protein